MHARRCKVPVARAVGGRPRRIASPFDTTLSPQYGANRRQAGRADPRHAVASEIRPVVTGLGRRLYGRVAAERAPRLGATRHAAAVAAVVLSVVAQLVGRDYAVAADAVALSDGVHEAVQRQLVVGLRRVTFRLKECDLVHAPRSEPERRDAVAASRVMLPFSARVKTAEIDRELAVDEDVNVVVAAEIQHFAALIRELVSKLAREGKVVLEPSSATLTCGLPPAFHPRSSIG